MKNIGIYWILNELSIASLIFALAIITLGAIFLMRTFQEGVAYQTSFSAQLGDTGFFVAIRIAAEIWKRGGTALPTLMQTSWFHIVAGLIAILVGIVWWHLDRPKYLGDIWHHLIIAPLFVYLGATLLPLIYKNGNTGQKAQTIFLVVFWVLMVIYDIKTNRLNQRGFHGLGRHLDIIKSSIEMKQMKRLN